MGDDEVLDDAAIFLSSSEDHNDGADALSPNQSKKRAANARRGPSVLWAFFTDDPNPHKLKSAECKHCHTRINYHKKSKSAKTHINTCAAFCQLTNGIDMDGRPSWYVPARNGS